MRALIYGGRDWRDQERMNNLLDLIHEKLRFTMVINGGQISRDRTTKEPYGADFQATEWARKIGVQLSYYGADWDGLGKKAGPIRNTEMLVDGKPDVGIEFPGHNGTEDMRKKLVKARVRIIAATKMTPVELEAL